MSMKNSTDTIGNRTRDLPTCSTVPQLTALPRAPIICIVVFKMVLKYTIDIISPVKYVLYCFVLLLFCIITIIIITTPILYHHHHHHHHLGFRLLVQCSKISGLGTVRRSTKKLRQRKIIRSLAVEKHSLQSTALTTWCSTEQYEISEHFLTQV